MTFVLINTKKISACPICTTPTQKGFLFADKGLPLCMECLGRFADLAEATKKQSRSERSDILHCEYWDREAKVYCAERGLWLLYHEGYNSYDRYAMSCRDHLEALSRDYEDGAERVIYVDEPWNESITDVRTSQIRRSAPDVSDPFAHRSVYITRTGGGLARITYLDCWDRAIEGKSPIWMPVEEIATRWPMVGNTA